MYVQVNIGRGTGDSTMSTERWQRFQSQVKYYLADHLASHIDHVEVHHGVGRWEDKLEDSAHLSIIVNDDRWGRRTNDLRAALRFLAKEYKQDAIALILVPDTAADLITA